MKVMVTSLPQPPPLSIIDNLALLSHSSPASILVCLPHFSPRRQRQATIVCSYNGDGLTTIERKILRERYGFDPSQITTEPSSVPFRKEREGKKGSEYERDKGNEGQSDGANVAPKRSTHRLLQVIGGKAKRKRLLSPKGMDVRPMMQVVKGSAFDILQAAGGCPSYLKPGRWLDLYSGTGSVGIEAMSRGCSEVHFVEMDPWVVTNVLRPNLDSTGFLDAAVIHTIAVETFLDRVKQQKGGNQLFDFISVTPPYAQVDFSALMDQIAMSSVVGEDTFIVVEYPLKTEILHTCGCLLKIAERRFGRTHLAIYGPKWAQKRKKGVILADKDKVAVVNFR